MAVLFFGAADAGALSSVDGAIVIMALALCFRAAALPLMLLLVSVQDAPGLAYHANYATYSLLATLIIIRTLPGLKAYPEDLRQIRWLGNAGLLVVAYALAMSLVQHYGGGHVQDMGRRNPFLVSGLMVMNILLARAFLVEAPAARNLDFAVMLALVHGLGVIAAQAALGPEALHSKAFEDLSAEEGLLEFESAFGVPRLTGTFLSPNAFAQILLHYGLLLAVFRLEWVRRPWFAWLFVLFAVVTLTLCQTKADTGIDLLAAAVLFVQARAGRFVRTVQWLAIAMVAGVAVAALSAIGFDNVLRALRLVSLGNSYRAQAIEAIFAHFTVVDWLFGMGLSHWEAFFSQYLSFSLADAHCWPLSFLGTYGVFGLQFYLLVLAWLLGLLRNASTARKFVAGMLFVKLAFMDLTEEPFLLNNATLSFLVWITMGLAARMPLASRRLPAAKGAEATALPAPAAIAGP